MACAVHLADAAGTDEAAYLVRPETRARLEAHLTVAYLPEGPAVRLPPIPGRAQNSATTRLTTAASLTRARQGNPRSSTPV